jgi:hypothetical protein
MRSLPPPLIRPVTLIVSDLHLEGGIRIQTPKPVVVRAFPGQEIHLKVRYRFHESSHARERVRIQFTSSIDSEVARPAEARLHDVPLHEDTYLGALEQHYRFKTSGIYEGEALLRVTYTESPWMHKNRGHESIAERRIPIRIEVQ